MEAAPTKKKATGKKKVLATLPVKKGAEHVYGDYLTTRDYSIKTKNADIKVEYPVDGDPTLVAALRQYILESLNENYPGSLSNPEALITSAIKSLDISEDLQQEIKVAYNGKNSITLTDDGYLYMGGAHGMPWSKGKSFLKSDGYRFGNYMLPPFVDLQPQIGKGLAKYFDVPVSSLKEEVMSWGTPDFTYPSTVYITDEGLTFIWEAYEIAPYSYGMPKVVLPANNELFSVLSEEAKEFF